MIVAGRRVEYWINLFFACHQIHLGGMGGATINQWRTPDGKPYLKQPAILTQIFSFLLGEVRSQLSQQMNPDGR